MPSVVIAGGGIVGLTTALELERMGYDVLVCERSATLRGDGAGIGLWPSAIAIFDRHGTADEIVAASAPLRQEIVDAEGAVLVPDAYPVDVSGYQAICAYRPELIRILGAAVGLENIRFAARVVGFEEDAQKVNVLFADGTSETADLLVGADGIWSAVRGQFRPEAQPHPHSQSMWRGVVPGAGIPLGEPGVVFAPGIRGGWLHAGGGLVYWFVGKFQPPGVANFADKHGELLREIGDWDSALPALVQATPEESIIAEEIHVLPPVDSLGSGRVALVGDAAHAMSPHAAFGACLGVEDAVVLGEALRAESSIPSAVEAYDTGRRPRIRWAYDAAREIAEQARSNNVQYGRSLSRYLSAAVRTSPGITMLAPP
jgi:2-polyprenyl-6-methoxyphenol hydroxylase-like FAD-dependent oxidoreductase